MALHKRSLPAASAFQGGVSGLQFPFFAPGDSPYEGHSPETAAPSATGKPGQMRVADVNMFCDGMLGAGPRFM